MRLPSCAECEWDNEQCVSLEKRCQCGPDDSCFMMMMLSLAAVVVMMQ